MDDLTAFEVASHWPLLLGHLHQQRARAACRVLTVLARRQFEIGGEAPLLSRGVLVAGGMTAGEASRASVVLRQLERGRAVVRFPGTGRRGDRWALTPAVRDWRGLPWRWSARVAHQAVAQCICRASFGVAARSPGQSVALPREDAENGWCPAVEHSLTRELSRASARLSRSPRGNAEATWENVACSRGNAEDPGALYLSSDVLRTSCADDDDESTRILRAAIGRATGGGTLRGAPERDLRVFCSSLSPAEATALAARADPTWRSPVALLDHLRQLHQAGAVAPAERRDPERLLLERRIAGLRAAGMHDEADQLDARLRAAAEGA